MCVSVRKTLRALQLFDLHHSPKIAMTELRRVVHGNKCNYRDKIFSLSIDRRLRRRA